MPYKDKLSRNKNFREWYARPENKARRREHSNAENRRLKAAVFELLGKRCVKCGCNDSRVLQIDHVNGDGAKERKSCGHNIYTLCRRVLANPERYQLLCA